MKLSWRCRMKHLPVADATAAILLNLLINIFRTEGPLHKATGGQERLFSREYDYYYSNIQNDTLFGLLACILYIRKANSRVHKEDAMKFKEKWDAIWMAITFAEAGEQDTAAAIYKETKKRAEKRVTERPQPRPRQRA